MIAAHPDANATPAGSLRVRASFDGTRTVVDALRYEGLSRCSRPLRDADGAVRLVVSQLGPGYVRGDRFTLDVTLGANARLRLAAQAAARVVGRGAASESIARLTLAAGAALFVANEPLVPYDGASHVARTDVALDGGAAFAWLDTVAPFGAFERVRSTLRVTIGGRLALHDAIALVPERLDAALGTAYFLRAGMSARRTERLVALADASAAVLAAGADAIAGVGSTASGGVTLRARGAGAGAIHAFLYATLERLRAADAEPDDAGAKHAR